MKTRTQDASQQPSEFNTPLEKVGRPRCRRIFGQITQPRQRIHGHTNTRPGFRDHTSPGKSVNTTRKTQYDKEEREEEKGVEEPDTGKETTKDIDRDRNQTRQRDHAWKRRQRQRSEDEEKQDRQTRISNTP